MTKEQAKQMAEVLNAYAEGKPIEVLLDGEWGEVDLNEYSFDPENESYRIKKELKYRPFKNAEECFEEMQKHKPVGWLRRWDDLVQIVSITDSVIGIWTGSAPYYYRRYIFKEVINGGITFADGQPFGIKE